MDTLNKLKDINLTNRFLDKIKSEVVSEISIMEVCGTHTNVILKNGIKDLLPEKIKLINGPGCPVCVTPQGYIDTAIKLSKKENMIITTFGDLMRVPGKESTLSKEKALGSDIRVVYSPLDSIKIARENPSKEVIFLGIGFETTAPIIAMSIKIACDENINNFSVFNSLKTMPEAMKSLVLNPNIKIDAFLCPGHVATIIGENQFKKLAVEYNIPMVIAGFVVNDILASIYTIIEMNKNNKNYLVNLYSRLVKKDGNINAVNIIHEVFEKSESIWRGIGKLDNAGLIIKNKYSRFDALNKFDIKFIQESDNKGCSCGEVLMGIKEPTECNLFGNICTPLTPIGACMVSEEGTCSAYYKYK